MVRCNGVFKGGGAKGVAYVGALEACEDNGVAFGAVAGSSAGAITATLVAAGFDTSDLRTLMPEALATIQKPARAVFAIGRPALLSNRRLRDWLDRVLLDRLARQNRLPADGERCSFSDLYAATGIGLFVVAMDLATRQPVVFSHELTPDMSVTDSVVASSAIPVAFPPSLVEIDGDIHRLVDGGAYANYPAFVFDDPSFRLHHQIRPVEQLPTIGFVLDQDQAGSPETSAWKARKTFPMTTDRGSVERELGIVGAVLGSPLVRWALVLLPLLFSVVVALWLVAEFEASFPVVGSIPARYNALEDVVVLVVLLVAATVSVIGVAAGLVLARLGRELLDGGVMGAVAAMGVGPSVPYWVGADNPHHIGVRLTVPAELTTLSFGAPDDLIEQAISDARVATAQRLAQAFGQPAAADDGPAWAPPTVPQPLGETETDRGLMVRVVGRLRRSLLESSSQRRRSSLWLMASLGLTTYLGFAAVGWAAFHGLANLINGQKLLGVAWLAGSGLGTVVGLGAFAARKHAVASEPFPVLSRFNDGLLLLAALLGIAMTLAIVGYGLSDDRAPLSVLARTDSAPAMVKHIDTTDENIPLVWIEIENLGPNDIDQLRRDHRGTAVTPCDTPTHQDDQVKRERIVQATDSLPEDLKLDRCIVLDTDDTMDIDLGDPEILRYDAATGLAFLELQMWSIGYIVDPMLYLIGIVAFLSLSYHCLRAVRWRQSRQPRA